MFVPPEAWRYKRLLMHRQGADVTEADGRFAKGLEIRRRVLGDEYVDLSIGRATEFSRPLQELITEYCWGAVWSRPGLDLKVRSLINLAIFTALNRPRELNLHVRGAIRNGCTAEDIREVLLQTAVYCGIPAALDSFGTAEAALTELGLKLQSGSEGQT